MDRRARRFQRYFTLAPLHNAGLSDEELQTYRNALNKLVNSLSWGSKIVNPVPVDPARTVFRIDLRWYVWDATIWNRILQEYPYGVLEDTTAARAATVGTLTKVPVIRADWFVATASRAPLYYDVLQLPASLTEVEKLLRVDAIQNIQQERVARLAFNGSGVSRFNRILERHDSAHGMYWRTYDFDEPPANLGDRLDGNLVPDPRNVFAFPLGPAGLAEFPFKHAGGEAIFALPNGLHAFYIANADNARLDKAPVAIVSDPKRPDRAVEAGVSCMSCHVTGILPKADQMLDHVDKNPKSFTRQEADLISALYPGKDKVLKLMEEDAKRYAEVVAKTGAKVSRFEAVSTITLKYEADLDLETAAAEVGLSPDAFRERRSPSRPRSAATSARCWPRAGPSRRQIWVQAFGDLTRELRLGTLFIATLNGATNQDNTGELDPLESRDGAANQMAFTADGRRAVIAAADRSVRLWDVEGRRDAKRFIGHTASVWAVALSQDGRLAISGSMDGTARVWDVASGQQLQKYAEHSGLVSAVAFNPNGRWGISGGFDGVARGVEGRRRRGTLAQGEARHHHRASPWTPPASTSSSPPTAYVHLFDLATGEKLRSHGQFADAGGEPRHQPERQVVRRRRGRRHGPRLEVRREQGGVRPHRTRGPGAVGRGQGRRAVRALGRRGPHRAALRHRPAREEGSGRLPQAREPARRRGVPRQRHADALRRPRRDRDPLEDRQVPGRPRPQRAARHDSVRKAVTTTPFVLTRRHTYGYSPHPVPEFYSYLGGRRCVPQFFSCSSVCCRRRAALTWSPRAGSSSGPSTRMKRYLRRSASPSRPGRRTESTTRSSGLAARSRTGVK